MEGTKSACFLLCAQLLGVLSRPGGTTLARCTGALPSGGSDSSGAQSLSPRPTLIVAWGRCHVLAGGWSGRVTLT